MKFKALSRLETTLGKRGFNQILVKPFNFMLDDDECSVPLGFESDRASVPRVFWNIIPPMGKYSIPALIHDLLYRIHVIRAWKPCEEGIPRTVYKNGEWSQTEDLWTTVDTPCSKAQADTIFLELMILYRVSKWRRQIMYRSVKWFGKKSWDANG